MCSPALAPSLPAVSAHTMSAWSTITFSSGHTHKHEHTNKVHTLTQKDITAPLTCSVLPPAFTMMKTSVGFCSDPGGIGVPLLHPSSFLLSLFPLLNKTTVSVAVRICSDSFSLISVSVSVLSCHRLLLLPRCQSRLPQLNLADAACKHNHFFSDLNTERNHINM